MTQEQQNGFAINDSKGFTMKFANGFVISVQFGYGNYCDNKNHPGDYNFHKHLSTVHSGTAEIAIWDADGNWFNFGSDVIKGYVSADEVAHWIYITMSAINLDHVAHMARMYHGGLIPPLDTTKFAV